MPPVIGYARRVRVKNIRAVHMPVGVREGSRDGPIIGRDSRSINIRTMSSGPHPLLPIIIALIILVISVVSVDLSGEKSLPIVVHSCVVLGV